MQQDDNIDLPPLQADPAVPQQPVGAAPFTTQITDDKQVPPAIAEMIAHLPEEANDIDLIEKEWIVKAKQVVAHTIEDPHHQQAAISHMKAEYMKKRYGKQVKGLEG